MHQLILWIDDEMKAGQTPRSHLKGETIVNSVDSNCWVFFFVVVISKKFGKASEYGQNTLYRILKELT